MRPLIDDCRKDVERFEEYLYKNVEAGIMDLNASPDDYVVDAPKKKKKSHLTRKRGSSEILRGLSRMRIQTLILIWM